MAALQEFVRMRRMVSRSDGSERESTVHTSEVRRLVSTRNFQRGCVSQTISEDGNDCRRAATAGKVCTMSPSEPRRTTRKRGSAMRASAHGIDERAGRMILGVANNRDTDAKASRYGALRNGSSGVVGTFGVNVRTKLFE